MLNTFNFVMPRRQRTRTQAASCRTVWLCCRSARWPSTVRRTCLGGSVAIGRRWVLYCMQCMHACMRARCNWLVWVGPQRLVAGECHNVCDMCTHACTRVVSGLFGLELSDWLQVGVIVCNMCAHACARAVSGLFGLELRDWLQGGGRCIQLALLMDCDSACATLGLCAYKSSQRSSIKCPGSTHA